MVDKIYSIELIPHGRKIEVKPGQGMMEALMENSIFLRSDCGGKGSCGKCRVEQISKTGTCEPIHACSHTVSEDLKIKIPESSLMSSHIISKAPVSLPKFFIDHRDKACQKEGVGMAVDLGTTTIALYLCDTANGKILSSLSVKNPQVIYGDDVMSRISAIGQDEKNLDRLQNLVVKAMEWGINELLTALDLKPDILSKMVIVGNPTMIHILAGVDPKSIGVSPYQPSFYQAQSIQSDDVGFTIENLRIQLLPQISGFIGGDILSAAIATDFEKQPEGTLLVDLGTNGELLLKAENKIFATSCATGPAFEGASLSCGMQAIPGAINKVCIKNKKELPGFTMIGFSKSNTQKPSGICGTGVISAVSELCKKNIIEPGGAFKKDFSEQKRYCIVPEIFISQKDIRSVQLGKAALITGIEFLLNEAGINAPEKIIIAGAFGSFLDKADMMSLGMIPSIDPSKIESAGNLAGVGAVMLLCDESYLNKTIQLSEIINVIDLACNQSFQDHFVRNLNFLCLF